MKILNKNPELQRNLWSEFSMQRLILMPSIAIIILVLITIGADAYDVIDVLIMVSYASAAVLLIFWGGKVAYDSIISEYNERTWDWQRMNALSSKQLLVGKLFGATAFNWYGGFICLAFWLFFTFFKGEMLLEDIIASFLTILILAIQLMCGTMIIALLQIRKGSARNRFKSGSIVFFLVLFGFGYISQAIAGIQTDYSYFGKGFSLTFFENVFYTIWAVIGVNQALRHELNYKNSSKLWYLFLFSAAIFKGFVMAEQLDDRRNLFFFMILAFTLQAIFFSYILLLFESKEPLKFKMLIQKIKNKDWKYLNYKAPLWSLTFPLIFIGIISTWLAFDLSYFISKYNLDTMPLIDDLKRSLTQLDTLAISGAIILFVLRDFLLMFLISMTSFKKRTNGAFVLYLFLLYFLLPLLIRDTDSLLPLFIPYIGQGALMCFLLPLIEVLIVVFVVRYQLNSRFKR